MFVWSLTSAGYIVKGDCQIALLFIVIHSRADFHDAEEGHFKAIVVYG